jgi:hypothetical protein
LNTKSPVSRAFLLVRFDHEPPRIKGLSRGLVEVFCCCTGVGLSDVSPIGVSAVCIHPTLSEADMTGPVRRAFLWVPLEQFARRRFRTGSECRSLFTQYSTQWDALAHCGGNFDTDGKDRQLTWPVWQWRKRCRRCHTGGKPGGGVLGWWIVFNEKRAAMTGTHITDQQIRLYMNKRKHHTQQTAAALAGLSERTARRI